jgi:hypothetical protein
VAWLRFVAEFDFTPPTRRGVTVAFKAGMCRPAPRACVAAATMTGAAEIIPTPCRAEARRMRQET